MHVSPAMLNDDAHFMRLALREAARAAKMGEVPAGAVITDGTGAVVARAHNLRESRRDPTAHAEMVAIRKAAIRLGGWRLSGCTLYVTMEPCPMCAGALVNARITRLVYGCPDPKAGACGTLMDICRDRRLNHRLEVTPGVLAAECAAMLKEFFRRKRKTGR